MKTLKSCLILIGILTCLGTAIAITSIWVNDKEIVTFEMILIALLLKDKYFWEE